MAAIYLVAFAAAFFQNQGLLGQHGLAPAAKLMDRLHKAHPDPMAGFFKYPAIFWWIPVSDWNMNVVHGMGLALSALGGTGRNQLVGLAADPLDALLFRRDHCHGIRLLPIRLGKSDTGNGLSLHLSLRAAPLEQPRETIPLGLLRRFGWFEER